MNASADALQARAEVLKLARILGRNPVTVAYLERVPLEDLRLLREQVTDVLWSADGHALSRLAAASRLLPAGVSANISQRAFGPLLTARLAGLLDPGRAVDVATRLPASFLADVAIELDPRRASRVIAQIPPEHIAGVTRELIAREEFVTMGRFVGHLSDEALAAALATMDTGELLQVMFVLEEPERIDFIVGMLSPERRRDLAQRARADGVIEGLGRLGQSVAEG
jgi:hypothetical protein